MDKSPIKDGGKGDDVVVETFETMMKDGTKKIVTFTTNLRDNRTAQSVTYLGPEPLIVHPGAVGLESPMGARNRNPSKIAFAPSGVVHREMFAQKEKKIQDKISSGRVVPTPKPSFQEKAGSYGDCEKTAATGAIPEQAPPSGVLWPPDIEPYESQMETVVSAGISRPAGIETYESQQSDVSIDVSDRGKSGSMGTLPEYASEGLPVATDISPDPNMDEGIPEAVDYDPD